MKQIIGTFLFPSGLPISGGTVKFLLSQDALSSDGQIAPVPQYTVLDSNGSIITSPPFELACQDELDPTGTYYTVTVSVPNRGIVYGPELFSLVGTSPINIDNIIPLPGRPRVIVAPTTGVSSLNSLLGDLTIEAGANVTVSEVGQNIVIASTASSTGTVTSVALVDNTGLFTVTGSPVTTSGTLTLSAFASRTFGNTFFATPNGGSGAPSFRTIAAADVPVLNQNTTGFAGGLSGNPTIAVAEVISPIFESSLTHPAASGVVRLANTDSIAWRNAANNADVTLGVDTSNNLIFSPQKIGRDPGNQYVNFTVSDLILNTYGGSFVNIPNNVLKLGSSAASLSGTIALEGSTSGAATITAPAVAGTSTNPITISNSLQLPSGTALSWNGDVGISRSSAQNLLFGNGTAGNSACNVYASSFNISGNAGTFGGTGINFNADTGLWRASAGVIEVGGGTASATGTINATTANFTGTTTTSTLAVTGLMTEYNGVSTVGQGIASIYAQTNLLLQGANIGATTMFAVPASGAGIYRIHVYLVVTRAGTTSTLPDSRITYTDQDSGAVITVPVTTMSTGNALTTFSTATIDINAKASTNVQFDVGQVNAYASTGATSMQFAYRNRLEYLG